jgi:phosphoserine phosphatase RsbU/P
MISIRWKFLAVLLGFSITPLLVFFVLNYRASLQLGEDLNDIARGLMVTTAGKELQEAAENYARNFGRELSRMKTYPSESELPALLEGIRPVTQWGPFVTSLFVRASEAGSFTILARRSIAAGDASWTSVGPAGASEWARIAEAAGLASELRRWPQGYGRLAYEGEGWVWAYAVVQGGLAFVHLLPERETVYRLTQSRGRLSRLYTLDTLAAAAAVLLLLGLVATVRSRKLIRPFLGMISALHRLSQGDFSARLPTAVNDERRMVAEAFNTMAVQLEDRMRIRQALEVARQVQQAFIPDKGVSLMDIEVAARVRYCEETGGDYIDLIPQGDRLGVVVSDVTGHGIGAALLMATARALIRGRNGEPGGPGALITSVNRNLSVDIGDSGRFMTLFFLEIDSVARRLQWVRAGHDPAWLFDADGGIRFLDGAGVALGVDEGYRFEAGPSLAIHPGDLVLIGTDGIWETRSPSGDLFGKERFERLVAEKRALNAAGICAAVLKAVDEFRAGAPQEDDVSVVAIKRNPFSLA